MKILLLEDDIILSEIIEEFLSSLGYKIVCSYDGLDASELAYAESFDLLLLDVEVPSIDGFEFLQNLREENINTPAIFITSLNTTKDLQKGFDVGCDDYIKKPFELSELEIRINNIKRLYKIESDVSFKFSDDISYEFSKQIVINDQKELTLAQKEIKILEYFIKNKNKLISVDELIVNVWGYDESPTNATIRTYIKNIRKVIGENFLITVKGMGYRLETG
jgi:DNA-binding response OmpR family regulator